MARVELKHSNVRLVDGYRATAAVNDTPLTGDTTLVIDTVSVSNPAAGYTGKVPKLARFTVVGSSETYQVTDVNNNERQLITVDATSGNYTVSFTGSVASPISTQTTANIAEGATAAAVQSALEALAGIAVGDITVTGSTGGPFTVEFKGAYEGLPMNLMTATDVDLMGGGDTVVITRTHTGNTTKELTFTPALLTADGIPADDAVITITGRALTIKIGEGNITYNQKKEYEYLRDRGVLDTVKEGDQQPIEVSIDFVWEEIASITDATPTVDECLDNIGNASDWVSSDTADPCAPYALDVEIEITRPCAGVQREIITLPDYRYEELDHNMDEATISSSGQCNVVRPSVVRVD